MYLKPKLWQSKLLRAGSLWYKHVWTADTWPKENVTDALRGFTF